MNKNIGVDGLLSHEESLSDKSMQVGTDQARGFFSRIKRQAFHIMAVFSVIAFGVSAQFKPAIALESNPKMAQVYIHYDHEGAASDITGTLSHQFINKISAGGSTVFGPLRKTTSYEYYRNGTANTVDLVPQMFTPLPLEKGSTKARNIETARPYVTRDDATANADFYIFQKDNRAFVLNGRAINFPSASADHPSFYSKSDLLTEVNNSSVKLVLGNAVAMSSPVDLFTGANDPTGNDQITIISSISGVLKMYTWRFSAPDSDPVFVTDVASYEKDVNGYLKSIDTAGRIWVGHKLVAYNGFPSGFSQGTHDVVVFHEVITSTGPSLAFGVKNKAAGQNDFLGFFRVETDSNTFITHRSIGTTVELLSSHPFIIWREGLKLYSHDGDSSATLPKAWSNYEFLWYGEYQFAQIGGLGTQYGGVGVYHWILKDKELNKVVYVDATSAKDYLWTAGGAVKTTFNGFSDFFRLYKNTGYGNNTSDANDGFVIGYDTNGVYHNTRSAVNTNTAEISYPAAAANRAKIVERSKFGFKYNTSDYKSYFQSRFSNHKKLLEETVNVEKKMQFVNGNIFGIGDASCGTADGTPKSGGDSTLAPYGTAYFLNNELLLDSWVQYQTPASNTECVMVPSGNQIRLVGIGSTIKASESDKKISFGATEGLTLADSMIDFYHGRVVGLSTAGDLLMGGVVYSTGTNIPVIRDLEPYPVFDPAASVLTASRGNFPDRVELSWTATAQANYYQVWRNGVLIKNKLNSLSYIDYDSGTGPSSRGSYQIKAIKENHITPAGGFILAQSSLEEGWINGTPTALWGYLEGVSGADIEGILGNNDPDGVNDVYTYTIERQPSVGNSAIVGKTLSHSLAGGIYGVISTKVKVRDQSGKFAIGEVPTVAKPNGLLNKLTVSKGTFEDRIEMSWSDLPYNDSAKVTGSNGVYYRLTRTPPGGGAPVEIYYGQDKSFIDTSALASGYSKGNAPSYELTAIASVRDTSGGLTFIDIYKTPLVSGWINRPPVIADAKAIVEVGNGVTITPVVTDPDPNESFTYSVKTPGQFGTAIATPSNFRYTPTPDTASVDAFDMTVTDSSGVSDTGRAIVYAYTNQLQNLSVDQGAYGDKITLDWADVNRSGLAETELIYYRVFARSTEDSDFVLIANNIPGSSYMDARQVVKNFTYTRPTIYKVEAYAKGAHPETLLWTTKQISGYVNNIPTRVGGVFETKENSTLTFTPEVDDLDQEDVHTFTITKPANYGSARSEGDRIIYQPKANYYGVDSFEVEAVDGPGGKVRGFVTIVTSALQDQPLTVSNGEFPDKIVATWPAVQAEFGNTSGSVYYKVLSQGPNDAIFQTLSPTFAGTSYLDNRGGLKDKSIGNRVSYKYESYLNINGVGYKIAQSEVKEGWINNPPQASEGYSVVPSGQKVLIPMTVTDPDFGDSFTFGIVVPPQNGTASIDGAGQLEYESNIGYWGTDNFTVEAVDRSGAKVRGDVLLVVTTTQAQNLNSSRGLFGDRIELRWNQPSVVWGENAGDIFYRVYGKQASDAGFTLLDPKRLNTEYDDIRPVALSKSYVDPMEYKLEWYIKAPNQNAEKVATSAIKKGWVNNAPTLVGGTFSLVEGTSGEFKPVIVDKDLPNDTHTFEVLSQPEFGTAAVSNEKVIYTPRAGYFGIDGFKVRATDFSGLSVEGNVIVAVTGAATKTTLMNLTKSEFKDSIRLDWTNLSRPQNVDGYQVTYTVEQIQAGKNPEKIAADLFTNTFTDKRASLVDFKFGLDNPASYRVSAFLTSTTQQTPLKVAVYGDNQGWINLPPKVTTQNIEIFQRDGAKEIPLEIVDIDPNEIANVSISKQGELGRGLYSFTDKKLFYQPSGAVGTDQITVGVTDRAGNFVTNDVFVQVQCQNPTIDSARIQDNMQALLFYEKGIQVTTSIEPCHASVKTFIQIIDSNGVIQEQTGHSRSMKIAFDNKETYYMRDLKSGDYTARFIVDGPTVVEATILDVPFTIAPTVMPKLTIRETTLTEDDVFGASVVQDGQSCQVTTDKGDAVSAHKCFVDWALLPLGVPNSNQVSVDGYPRRGADQLVEAVISVFDSAQNKIEVGRLTERVSVLPGLPVLMTHPFFGGEVREIQDFQKYSLSRKSGYECTFYTEKDKADRAFLKDPFAKICLFKWDQLPKGMYPVAGTPTAHGRAVDHTDVSVKYTVSKYFRDGSSVDMPQDGFDIPLFAVDVLSALRTSQESYVVNGQKASAEVYDSAARDEFHPCRMTTSVEEAKSTYVSENANTIACLIQFKTIPQGMYSLAGSTRPNIEGVPKTLGENAVEWEIKTVLPTSDIITVDLGSGKIIAKNPSSPLLSFTGSGNLPTVSRGGQPIGVIDADVPIGRISVDNAEFGTVKVSVAELGTPRLDGYPSKSKGAQIDVVSRNSDTAWKLRQFEAYAEYEDAGAKGATPVKILFEALQAPPAMRGIIETNVSEVPDNKPFSILVSVANRDNGLYKAEQNGNWQVHLSEIKTGGLAKVSQTVPVDSEGIARFEALDPESYRDRRIVAVLTSVEYPDSTFEYVSRPVQVALVRGGPVPANLTFDKTSGFTPLTVNMKTNLENREDMRSVGDYTYEFSKNGGATWEIIGEGRRPSFSFVIAEGGAYKFRTKLKNVYSGAEFITNVVDVKATQAYNADIRGVNLLMPGETTTLTSVVTHPVTGNIVDPSEYDLIWVIDDRRSGIREVRGAPTVDVNHIHEGIVRVVLKVKSKVEPEDNTTAYTVITEDIAFGVGVLPRVSANGDRFVEVGSEAAIKSIVREGWGRRKEINTELRMAYEWELPDGTILSNQENLFYQPEDFNPDTEDPRFNPTIRYKSIMLRAWVDGYKDKTLVETEHRLTVTKYMFPTFGITSRADSLVAPAFTTLELQPIDLRNRRYMAGKKLQYEWSIPPGMSGRGFGARFNASVDQDGTYPVSVTVTDDRGNRQTLDMLLEVTPAAPWKLDVKMVPGLRYNRAPMTWIVQADRSGGHPRDRLRVFETFVNGVSIGKTDRGYPIRQIVMPQAGDYEVRTESISEMGKQVESVVMVTVLPNQPPECDELAVTTNSDQNANIVTAVCSDYDGRLGISEWFVNGVKHRNEARRMIIDWNNDPLFKNLNTATLTFRIIDDSHSDLVSGEAVKEIVLGRPLGAKPPAP